MDQIDILKGAFDIKTHKHFFTNYLEVVILNDGTIEYAVPSHQIKILNILSKKLNLTHDEINNICPKDRYFDFIDWLCEESECVSVWNNFYVGNPNSRQIETLNKLKKEHLYFGKI